MNPINTNRHNSDKSNFQNLKTIRRILLLLLFDSLSIIIAFIGAFLLRNPVSQWADQVYAAIPFIPHFVFIGWAMFGLVGMYRTLWRYASVDSIFIIGGGTILAVAVPAIILILFGGLEVHWTIFIIQWMVLFMVISAGRFSLRLRYSMTMDKNSSNRKRILIYGAGDAGEMICRDLKRSKNHNFNLIGFIDDDTAKRFSTIHNIPILGGREQIPKLIEQKKIDEIILAMPSLSGDKVRNLHNYLIMLVNGSVKLRTLPGINELINDVVTLKHIRRFRVRDLLRRNPVELDKTPVERLTRSKTILVSGGGGSIGSEICRQTSQFSPKQIVIVDISEASLYTTIEELTTVYGDIPIIPVVGDICNKKLMRQLFDDYHPEIVFHAAAYKHVPLMESNPWSAVYNNVKGTRVLAELSAEYEVERFVMISTDKAVRPTSMMGATKRMCEMIVQSQTKKPGSIFCIVRFGNVMGSSGSVIPKFGKQIKKGGPVTVTHRKTTRYFMLTSEAVQLVMQASTLGNNETIYILDMGEPVSINDLAADMIRLSGFEPNVDIKIEYTGLRPGEKLYEELYHSGTGKPTPIEKITSNHEPVKNPEFFLSEADNLIANCFHLSRRELFLSVAELVPDYTGAEVYQDNFVNNDSTIFGIGKIQNLKTA